MPHVSASARAALVGDLVLVGNSIHARSHLQPAGLTSRYRRCCRAEPAGVFIGRRISRFLPGWLSLIRIRCKSPAAASAYVTTTGVFQARWRAAKHRGFRFLQRQHRRRRNDSGRRLKSAGNPFTRQRAHRPRDQSFRHCGHRRHQCTATPSANDGQNGTSASSSGGAGGTQPLAVEFGGKGGDEGLWKR